MSKVLTLYYHRINDISKDYNQLSVSLENFRQQLLWLKKKYRIIDANGEWNKITEDSVCITFDDGYIDNYENALTVLEELQVPATVFVATGCFDNMIMPWWDVLEECMLKDRDYPSSLKLSDKKLNFEWDTSSYNKRINCYQALHFLMKNIISKEQRNRWLEMIKKWSGIEISERTLMTKKICQRMNQSKYINIGAHTVTHPSLATLEMKEQYDEIINSKSTLSCLISEKVDLFSYPFGNKDYDYDSETIEIVKKSGICKAFTTNTGVWREGDSFFEIPRCIVRNWGYFEFKDKIEEYWNG